MSIFSIDWLWRRWAKPYYQRQEIMNAAGSVVDEDSKLAILGDKHVHQALADYERDDGRAMFFQACHVAQGWVLCVIAGLGLLTIAASLGEVWRFSWASQMSADNLATLQYGLIACLAALGSRWFEMRWLSARTAAERHRGRIFGAIVTVVSPNAQPTHLIAGKFAVVEQAHAQDQLNYFKKKAVKTTDYSGKVAVAIVAIAFGLTAGALLLAGVSQSIAKLNLQPFLPKALIDYLSIVDTLVTGEFRNTMLVAFGFLAFMRRALSSSRLSAKDSTLYAAAAKKLDSIVSGASLYIAASRSNPLALHAYVDRIRVVLVEVHDDWAFGRRSAKTADVIDLLKDT